MRLLFVGNPRSPHFIRPLRRLIEMGHDVLVFGYSPPPGDWPSAMRFVQHPMHDHPRAISMLREIGKTFRPDVIHVHWADALAWQCVEADVAPTIVSVWGSDVNRIVAQHPDGTVGFDESSGYERAYGDFRMLAATMHRLAHIIVDDPIMVRKCRLLGGERVPIHLIPLGVEECFLSPVPTESVLRVRGDLGLGPEDKMLLSVRAFRRHYGHMEILEAFARSHIHDNVHLVFKLYDPNTTTPQDFQGHDGISTAETFVFRGEAEELRAMEIELRQRIGALGLDGRVHCISAVSDASMPALVAAADAVVNFPTMDGFPVTFLEAAAVGTQVITCMHPSYANSFVEQCFHVVPERTVEALAQAIESFANEPDADVVNRKIQARQAVLTGYTFDHYIEKLLLLYEDARGRYAEAKSWRAHSSVVHPRVSILIPCHDYAHLLEECLQSLIAQSVSDWEAIVVDDGSTKGDVEMVISKIADRRIHCIRFPINRGKGCAFNAAFRKSKADIIMLLDADDIVQPKYLEYCLEAFDRNPGLDVVYTDIQLFGSSQAVWEYPMQDEAQMTLVQWIPGPGPLMRRSVYAATGGHYEGPELRYGNIDWEFWIAATRRKLSVMRIPHPLYRYRQHANTISTKRPYNDHITRECIFRLHEGLFSLWGTGPKFRSEGHAIAAKTAWSRGERLRAALLAARAYSLAPPPLPQLSQPVIPPSRAERVRNKLEKLLDRPGTEALEVRSEIIDARLTLAALLFGMGEQQNAVHQYHILLGQLLETEDIQSIAKTLLVLALSDLKSGDRQGATEALECLHAVHPALQECEQLRVQLALDGEDWDKALCVARQFADQTGAAEPAMLVLGQAVSWVLRHHEEHLFLLQRQLDFQAGNARPSVSRGSLFERIYATELGRRLYWSYRAKYLYEKYGHLQGGFVTLAAALDQVKPQRVLEVGCGNGRLLALVVAHGIEEVVGQDISATALDLARKRQLPGVILHECPVDQLPYPEGYFDLIVCNRVLQHIQPDTLPEVLKTIRKLGRNIYINEAQSGDENAQSTYYIFHHDYPGLLSQYGDFTMTTLNDNDQKSLLFKFPTDGTELPEQMEQPFLQRHKRRVG